MEWVRNETFNSGRTNTHKQALFPRTTVVLHFTMITPLFMRAESYISNSTWLTSTRFEAGRKWEVGISCHTHGILLITMVLMRILRMESWDSFHFAVRIERRRLVKLHVFESRETPVYEPSKLTLGDEGLFWPFSSFFVFFYCGLYSREY